MNTNKEKDPLKGEINASFLETPPSGFTASVMSRLPEPTFSVTYKPVITAKGWILIGGLTVALIFLGLFSGGNGTNFSIPEMRQITIPAFSFDRLLSITAMPMLMLVALVGLFYVVIDARIRKHRTDQF